MTQPIERDPIYRDRRFQTETIELCVRWYVTYRLSDFLTRAKSSFAIHSLSRDALINCAENVATCLVAHFDTHSVAALQEGRTRCAIPDGLDHSLLGNA